MRNLPPIILNMMNSKMLIFFLKNNSEFDKKDHIKNLVSFIFVIDVPVTTRRPMMYYHCLLQCGANCHSTETISNDGSNWEQKLKIGQVWTSLEIYLKVLNGKKVLKGCAYTKGATSHSHLSSTSSILNEKGERKFQKFQ